MNFRNFLVGATVGATAALISAAPAMASTTHFKCLGYTVALSDDLVIQGEVLAGSAAAFKKAVCERADALAAEVENDSVTTIPVFIDSLNMATRVVIFKHGDAKSRETTDN